MKKINIRCYKTLANVYPGVYNYPVYYLSYEGWANFSFVTCIECGELFVIDWENPKTKGLGIDEIAGSTLCPTCNSYLKDTVKPYPQNIKLPNGKVGKYIPDNYIPPEDESIILEVLEIHP